MCNLLMESCVLAITFHECGGLTATTHNRWILRSSLTSPNYGIISWCHEIPALTKEDYLAPVHSKSLSECDEGGSCEGGIRLLRNFNEVPPSARNGNPRPRPRPLFLSLSALSVCRHHVRRIRPVRLVRPVVGCKKFGFLLSHSLNL